MISFPWLFAGAAVAYLVWQSRGEKPSAIPSLSPAPLPSLSAPQSNGGTSPLLIAAVLLPWGLLAASHFSKPHPAPVPPAPAPAPDNWPALDLRGAFVGPDAQADATTTESLLRGLADAVAWDGKQSAPRLTTAAEFDDLRKNARDFRMEGITLGAKQPIAKDRIAAFLDSTVGTDGGPVDAAERMNWVRAFQDISKAAARAAGR